jgi:predicted dehydrogenase
LARTFAKVPGVHLRWICELDSNRRDEAQRAHPQTRVTAAVDDVLSDDAVAAAVVAVDAPRHHAVGFHVLSAGRHLLVEKPMALSVTDAVSLHDAAVARKRVLTVGHLLLHHPAVQRTKALLDAGTLGEPLYFESTRTATPAGHRRSSAWWSLAPHDVSTALYVFDRPLVAVSATGIWHSQANDDVAVFATLHFADGRVAHVHASRMAAVRQRRFSVVGTERAVAFDELAPNPVLRLTAPPRQGGATAPEDISIEAADPLYAQCAHFASAASRGDTSSGNSRHALTVVRALEAGARSMAARGAPIEVA